MKKSESLKLSLDELETNYDKKLFEMVGSEGHLPENRGDDWNNFNKQFGLHYRKKISDLKTEILKEKNREVEVGDGVTICLYSDKYASTIIKRTKATITVQRDKAIKDPNFKPNFIVGGFAAHCTNQDEQSYTYESDPDGLIETFRWSEKHGRFQGGGDGSITVINGRHEFHDYNF